jgi:hypothetical protein
MHWGLFWGAVAFAGAPLNFYFLSLMNYCFNLIPPSKSYKQRSQQKKPVKKSQIWADAVLYIIRTSPVFRPPETSVIAAGRAEGGGAHRHWDADSADCGAAQAANRRRKRKGELRASASLPRGRSSSACTTHPAF